MVNKLLLFVLILVDYIRASLVRDEAGYAYLGYLVTCLLQKN